MTPEEIKRLAEWAGFTFFIGGWKYPDGTKGTSINFPEDETACFKWFAPKLQYLHIYYDKKLGFAVFIDDGEVCYDGSSEKLALALCEAILKLVEAEDE